jgi:hypothetical protein
METTPVDLKCDGDGIAIAFQFFLLRMALSENRSTFFLTTLAMMGFSRIAGGGAM